MFTTIKSFDQIYIDNTKKTLIICDIDDTILTLDVPYDKINNFIKSDIERQLIDKNNKQEIYRRYKEYKTYYKLINRHSYKHTDKTGFQNMEKKIHPESRICFLTARSVKYHVKTIEDLNIIGLEGKKYNINYTENIVTKGEFIKNFMSDEVEEYEDIIFIDDNHNFISSVIAHVPKIRCYKFTIDDYMN